MIANLPAARDDETLYSLLARLRLTNGAPSGLHLCRQLFGNTQPTMLGEFPIDFEAFARATDNLYGDAATVRECRTLSPLYRAAEIRARSSERPLWSSRGGLLSVGNGLRKRWRSCAECLRDDQAKFGVAHWRRLHHVQALPVCSKHGVRLHEVALPNSDRDAGLWLPEDLPMPQVGSRQPREDPVLAAEIRLIRLAEKMLLHAGARESDAVRLTLHSALKGRRLLSPRRTLRIEAIAAEIERGYGPIFVRTGLGATLARSNLQRALRTLAEPLEPAPTLPMILCLVLIDWLVGDWAAYQQRREWELALRTSA